MSPAGLTPAVSRRTSPSLGFCGGCGAVGRVEPQRDPTGALTIRAVSPSPVTQASRPSPLSARKLRVRATYERRCSGFMLVRPASKGPQGVTARPPDRWGARQWVHSTNINPEQRLYEKGNAANCAAMMSIHDGHIGCVAQQSTFDRLTPRAGDGRHWHSCPGPSDHLLPHKTSVFCATDN